MPFFTVIIPVFNGAAFMEEAIQSVIAQQDNNWELLIVDDGSTDGSLQIAEKYAQQNKAVKLLRHPGGTNKGVSASRNLGIQQANGIWIALLDADDVWYPEKLKVQHQILSDHDIVFTWCDSPQIDEKGALLKGKIGSGIAGLVNDPFKKLINGFHASSSAIVFKRDVAMAIGGYEENMTFSEDTLFHHRMLEAGSCYYLNKALLDTRRYATSSGKKMPLFFKAGGRIRVYQTLLTKSNPSNRSTISFALINIGYEKLLKTFFFKETKSIFDILISILKDKQILFSHKLYALLLTFLEPFLTPIRWLIRRKKSS